MRASRVSSINSWTAAGDGPSVADAARCVLKCSRFVQAGRVSNVDPWPAAGGDLPVADADSCVTQCSVLAWGEESSHDLTHPRVTWMRRSIQGLGVAVEMAFA